MNTENLLLSAVKYLIILALLTPLIISNFTLFPYITGKSIAFQILVEVALIYYIWLLYLNKKRTGCFNYLPQLNLFSWTLIIFLLILILNNIFSVDPYYSFWSKQERMEGLFNLFHFFAFFFIIASVIKEKEDWFKIFNVTVGVSFVITLIAFTQKLGWVFNPYGERVTGTLGNAAFLGTYLLLNIFFAVYLLLFFASEYWQKFLYGAVIFMEAVALILTQTRGAIYGLIASVVLFALSYIFIGKNKQFKKYALVAVITIFLAGSSLLIARNTHFIKSNPYLYRLSDISLQKGTGRIRLTSWKIGLNAFLKKPILGWGEENYYVAFNKYVDPVFYTYSGETFDRAHNKLVDLLVMNGILGFFAYLSVFVSALWLLFKKRKELGTTFSLLVALLGAYFFQNLLLFDMPTSYLMFFLALGLINYTVSKEGLETEEQTTRPQNKQLQNKEQNQNNLFRYLVWLLTFILILVIYSGNLKPLNASKKAIEGQRIISGKNQSDEIFKQGVAKFQESTQEKIFTNPEARKLMAQTIIQAVRQRGYSPEVEIAGLKAVASQLEQGIQEMPNFLDYYLYLTDVYNVLGSYEKEYYPKAEETITKAIELYPNVPYLYYKLIPIRLAMNKYNEALKASEKVMQLNSQLALSNWYYGVAQFYVGNIEAAKEATTKAINLGYSYKNDIASIYYLAQLSEKLKDYDMAIKSYEEILRLSPNNYYIKYELARVYKQKGNMEKAREIGQEIIKSGPQELAEKAAKLIYGVKNIQEIPSLKTETE